MSSSQVPYRTVSDVITILDPRGGGGGSGKKRRRDDETADIRVSRDFGALASRVLSAPPPAKVACRPASTDEAEADGSSGAPQKEPDGAEKTAEEEKIKEDGDDNKDTTPGTAVGADTTTTPSATRTASSTKSSDRIASLRAQLEAVKGENDAISQRRKDVFLHCANLASVYNYGLSHIATLNDIATCPDNTLPGNHPPPSSSEGK